MVAITNQDQAKRVFDGLTSGGRWQSNELSSYVSKKLFKELLERDDCLEYLPDPSVWAGKVDLSSGHLKAVKNGDHLAVFNISYAARDMIRHINDFLRELDITLSDESLPEDRKRNAEKLLKTVQHSSLEDVFELANDFFIKLNMQLSLHSENHRSRNEMFSDVKGASNFIPVSDGKSFQLVMPRALKTLAVKLNNCLSSSVYAEQVRKGTKQIWALVDADGDPIGSLDLSTKRKTIREFKGRNNIDMTNYMADMDVFAKAVGAKYESTNIFTPSSSFVKSVAELSEDKGYEVVAEIDGDRIFQHISGRNYYFSAKGEQTALHIAERRSELSSESNSFSFDCNLDEIVNDVLKNNDVEIASAYMSRIVSVFDEALRKDSRDIVLSKRLGGGRSMFTKNDGRELVNPLADIFYIKEKGDMGVMYSKSGMFGFWMKGVTGKSFKLSSVSIEELVNHAADASTRDVMNAFVAGVKEARINHSNAWGFALNTYNMPEQELVTLMELDLARIVQFDFEKAKRLDPFIEHFSEVPLEELDVDVDVSALSGFSPRAYKLDRLGANRDATAIAVECPVTGDIKTAAVIYKRSDKSVLGAAGYDNGLKYNIAYQDFIQDNGLKFVPRDGLSWPGGVEPEMAVDLEKTNFFDHDQGYAILKRPKKQVYCVMRKGPSGSFVDGTVMATFSKRGDGVSVRDMYPHDVDLAVDSLTFVKEEMGVRLDLHKDACKFRYTGKNIPDLLNDAGYAAIGGDIVKMPFSKLAKYNQDDVKINVTSVDGTVFFNVRSKRLSFERGALHIETEQLLSPADIKAVRAIEEEVGVKVPVADRDYFGVTGGSASPDEVIKVGDVSLKRCVGDVQGKGNRFTGAYEIFDGPEADGEPIGRVDVFGAISLDKSFPTALISSLEAVRLGIENGLYEEAITLKSENVA